MTDTHTDNGAHDVHEHDMTIADTAAPADELDAIARAARAARARHTARIDQLVADRDRINDAIAVERAEVERCDAILGWQRKVVQPRNKRKPTPATAKGKR